MVDYLWLGLGVLAGVLATALAFEFGVRRVRNPEASKLTGAWNLGEVAKLQPPRMVAERVQGLRVPDGAKLVVKEGAGAVTGEVVRNADVRMHPEVRTNFVLGEDKALVFTSHVHPDAMVVTTRDGTILGRLESEFDRLWNEGEPYVERVHVKDLPGRENVEVDVRGTVAAVMDYRSGKMLRISEGGETVGVLATGDQLERLKGESVRVVGTFRREEGYGVIDARKIQRLRKSQPETGM